MKDEGGRMEEEGCDENEKKYGRGSVCYKER
jgi:hypothetical protein